MKKNTLLTLIPLFCVILSFVGCASSKIGGMKTHGKSSEIVDWADRSVDGPAKPEWLKKLILGNSEVFKTDFGIDKSYVIKYSIASGKTRDLAKAASRVNYNAMRAEELRTKVVSEAAATLNDDGMTEATANAATLAKVDLSGHELVTQFWQEIETFDPETELKSREFICYSVYKITKENWLETLKNYMKSVLPSIPDSDAQKKMAATIASLYEGTTTEVEKTEAETMDEINAKLDAITSEIPSTSSPAPSAADAEWLDILETACNIIF